MSANPSLTFADRALPLIARNIPVIPCQPLAKHTLLRGGPERGSVDPAVIATWNADNPNYNVGCLGTLENLALFDCDAKGLVAQIEKETGQKMPPTFTVKSANKGTAHLYFKQTERSRALGNAVHRAGEVRGNNQYVVGPGSVIVCDDGATRGYEIWRDAPLADFPDWLVDWVRSNPPSSVRNDQTGELEGDVFSKLKEIYHQNLDPEEWFGRKDIPTITSLHPMLMSLGALLHNGERTVDEIADLLDRVGREYGHRDPLPKDTRGVAEWAVRRKPCDLEPVNLPPVWVYSAQKPGSQDSCLWTFSTEEAYAVFKNRCEQTPAWAFAAEWKDPEGWPELPADYEAWKAAQPTTEKGFKFPRVEGGKVSDYLLLPKQSSFDGWCGRGRTHIIAGSSGSGKTTLMVPILLGQWEGNPFFGHAGAGLRPLVLFADRGKLSNEETLLRLGLKDTSLPISHLGEGLDNDALTEILKAIESQNPLPQVVFVEGADTLVTKAGDGAVVSRFMKGIEAIAEHYHISFILSVGAPKSRPKDQHTLVRDRVFGSEKWVRKADMVLSLSAAGDGTLKQRHLVVQYRNAADEKFDLEFLNGKLVESAPSIEDLDALELWILDRNWFTRGEAAAAMTEYAGMSKANVNKRILRMCREGKLETRPSKDKKVEELRLKRAPLTPEETELQGALEDFSTLAVQI